MILLPIIILALVQGITEFLPISSSGHLVLVHRFFDMGGDLSARDGKILDIAVHMGTLLAVILYFRDDFLNLLRGARDIVFRRDVHSENAQKTLQITLATIPVFIAGYILFSIDITLFDSLYIMGWMTLIFGIVLYIADRRPQTDKTLRDFTYRDALFYGLMQVLALVPGVSRSGITMTAGRFLGHSRVQAARFSLLMGMATIAGAGLLTGWDVMQGGVSTNFLTIMAIAAVIAFITAYATILIMMRWLKHESFTPFVFYRIVMGAGLLILLYSGVIA